MPGWEGDSWGWHGDEGALYHDHGYYLAQDNDWTYGTSDIIGCCVDTSKGTASFAKNGKPLGEFAYGFYLFFKQVIADTANYLYRDGLSEYTWPYFPYHSTW